MIQSRRKSLAEFLRDNYCSLVDFVRSKLADSSERDSEDIVQDVVLNILDRPDITDPIINLSAYVFRALKNRIVDEYRKPRNRIQSMDEEPSLYESLPDMKYEPAGSFARSQIREQIYSAIADLPADQQEVIIETEFNQTSFKEFSRKKRTPVGTLLARKHRGLKTIQRKLHHIREDKNGIKHKGG